MARGYLPWIHGELISSSGVIFTFGNVLWFVKGLTHSSVILIYKNVIEPLFTSLPLFDASGSPYDGPWVSFEFRVSLF